MTLSREQKTVLKVAAVTLVFTGVLIQAMLPFLGIRKDPTLSFVLVLGVEALLFGVAFWAAGKGRIR
ncbi:hypothetical protein D3C72_2055270 [compost metagenome]